VENCKITRVHYPVKHNLNTRRRENVKFLTSSGSLSYSEGSQLPSALAGLKFRFLLSAIINLLLLLLLLLLLSKLEYFCQWPSMDRSEPKMKCIRQLLFQVHRTKFHYNPFEIVLEPNTLKTWKDITSDTRFHVVLCAKNAQ
jgi:hypothetical protein